MAITRREAFKNIAKGSLPILAAGCVSAGFSEVAHDNEVVPVSKGALGLLYDATKCVGCKSCMVACSQANNLTPDTRIDGIHQAPPALNYFTKNIIKLYRTADGSDHSYFKQQCMHCVDPTCVTACMFGGHAQGQGNRGGLVARLQVRWLPILRDRLPFPHSGFPVGWLQSQNRQMRALPRTPRQRSGARLHHSLPNSGGDLRTP